MSFLSNILVGTVGGGSLIAVSNIGEDLGSLRVYSYLLLIIIFMVIGMKIQVRKQRNLGFKKKFADGFSIYSVITILYFTYEAASSNYFSRISTMQSASMMATIIIIGLALSGLIAFLYNRTSN